MNKSKKYSMIWSLIISLLFLVEAIGAFLLQLYGESSHIENSIIALIVLGICFIASRISMIEDNINEIKDKIDLIELKLDVYMLDEVTNNDKDR